MADGTEDPSCSSVGRGVARRAVAARFRVEWQTHPMRTATPEEVVAIGDPYARSRWGWLTFGPAGVEPAASRRRRAAASPLAAGECRAAGTLSWRRRCAALALRNVLLRSIRRRGRRWSGSRSASPRSVNAQIELLLRGGAVPRGRAKRRRDDRGNAAELDSSSEGQASARREKHAGEELSYRDDLAGVAEVRHRARNADDREAGGDERVV